MPAEGSASAYSALAGSVGARRRRDWQERLRAWRVLGWSPRPERGRRSTPCRRLRSYGAIGSRAPFPSER